MPEERRRRRGLPGGLIDGFVVVVALLAVACGAPPHARDAAARSTPLEGVSPAGAVSPALTFRWNGNPTDGVVRVSIEDRAQRPIFAFPARGPSAPAPDGLAAVLTPGESFSWTVAAVDENGEPSRVSKPIQFSVAHDR